MKRRARTASGILAALAERGGPPPHPSAFLEKRVFLSKLAAGKLRHRIQIVRAAGTTDSFGGVPSALSNWTVLHDAWAAIDTLNGRDMLTSDQFMSTVNLRVTIRYFSDVDASCRVWFNGRTFQITAVVNPDQRTKMLVLLCVEINDSKQQPPTPAETTVT